MRHDVRVERHDGTPTSWGWHCLTCGAEDAGFDGLAEAEVGADCHEREVA